MTRVVWSATKVPGWSRTYGHCGYVECEMTTETHHSCTFIQIKEKQSLVPVWC